MATVGTIIFCLIGAVSLFIVWAICESDGSSQEGCMGILAGLLGILVSLLGLYACGTLESVLKAVFA
jgi:hypothetical protein